jgi:DNA-directed RNA polymerase specialized sigma24 family protein
MLHSLAASFSRTYGLDAQELFQEVQIPALLAIRKWQEGKGTKLSTYVYLCVKRWLISKGRRKQHKMEQIPIGTLPARSFSLRRLFTDLNTDLAKIAVRLALAGLSQREIIKSLQEDFALEVEEIGQVFREVREALS